MTLQETRVDSVTVRYTVRGEGFPLLLIHGWINDHTVWRGVWPHLERDHRCILLDLPGFGQSDKPSPDDYPYDAEAFVRAAVGVLDALGIERAHVVGHSMGAGIGLVLSASHPGRVARLVVADPAAYPTPLTIKRGLARLPILGPFIFKHLYGRLAVYDFLTNDAYSGHSTVDMAQVAYLYDRFNTPASRRAAYATLMRTVEPVERIQRYIPQVSHETLILWGSEDRLIPPSYGRRLVQDLPHARLHMMEGACHVCVEEFPNAAADLIREHLAAGDAPGKPGMP